MNRLISFACKSTKLCRNIGVKHAAFLGNYDVRLSSSKALDPTVKFTPLYYLPEIRIFSFFNILKKYQLGATIITLPIVGTLEMLSVLPQDTVIPVCIIGAAMSIAMFIASYFLQNTIGAIYISEDAKTAKISIVDYWGKRVDKILPIQNIIPVSETPRARLNLLYCRVREYREIGSMKLFYKSGTVFDREKLIHVIGAYED